MEPETTRVVWFKRIHHGRYITPPKSRNMSHLRASGEVGEGEDAVAAPSLTIADTIERGYSI